MSQKAAVIADSPVKGALTQVAEIPIYKPSSTQILIKTVAVAANPTDWKHVVYQQGSKGDITGSDASGVVEEVGADVKGFSKGDLVSTFLHGNFFKERGAFTEHVIADPSTTIKYTNATFESGDLSAGSYPAGKITTFEGAASVTLSLVTSVLSIVGNLRVDPKVSGYFLVWGGASSTGIIAIQVIKKFFPNLKVIVAASKKHTELLKSLGTDFIVDYHDSDAIEQIKSITKGEIKYVFDVIASPETFQQAYDATADSKSVRIDSTLFLGEKDIKKDSRTGEVIFVQPTLAYVANGDKLTLFGAHHEASEETLALYNDFWFNKIPSLIPDLVHPGLKVLAKGLESANEALELLQDNKVSGEKVVFRV